MSRESQRPDEEEAPPDAGADQDQGEGVDPEVGLESSPAPQKGTREAPLGGI
jgi:hypothetical protein